MGSHFSLKELDAKALKTLSKKVNVIPIIAKADTMTVEEKQSFKSILLRDLEDHSIKTFPSSYAEDVDGAEELLVSGWREHARKCTLTNVPVSGKCTTAD